VSLETWKAEFYPIRASRTDEASAVAHSLRKWEGLRASALEEHQVELASYGVRSTDPADTHNPIPIDYSSCSLCYHFYLNDGCDTCPLAETLGNGTPGYGCKVPFEQYRASFDPEPMIAALKRTLERQGEGR